MKRYLIFLTVILSNLSIFAQEKGDFVWMFGRNNSNNPFFRGSVADFNSTPIFTYQQDRPISFRFTNSSICDDNGDLLFYTNGRFIVNKNNEVLENGDNLNLNFTVGSQSAMGMVQGALILNDPGDSLQYYIFHLGREILQLSSGINMGSLPFFYTKVDYNSINVPEGMVIDKNTVISSDTFDVGKMVATRHGNGRDWWIILSEWETNRYYSFYISPDGIENLGTQEVGSQSFVGLGQAVFSPDGSKYVKLSLRDFSENYLDIYDFNRCNGLLENHEQLFFTDNIGAGGVAISPSSQYLYLITTNQIRQFDLWADDVFASQDTVAIYDGYQELVGQDSIPVPTNFFMGQLGPDGNIYICSPNSVSSLTVINEPDLQGEDCDVQQHGFSLASLNYATLPTFPNYRLGALEGSSCDTLNIVNTNEEQLVKKEIKIHPNPTTGDITLQISSAFSNSGEWVLYNQLGQIVDESELTGGIRLFNISLESLAKGIYFYSIFEDGRLVDNGKIVLE